MVARGLMFGTEYRPRHFEVYLVVSQNMGTPKFTPTNTTVLLIGTHNFPKPLVEVRSAI